MLNSWLAKTKNLPRRSRRTFKGALTMSAFCKQCSIRTLGEDFKDFEGETSIKDYAMGYAALALCEGCGWIQG